MSRFSVRFTPGAERDLDELQDLLAARSPAAARRALAAVRSAMKVLREFPFSCRKCELAHDPRLREMLIPFGSAGYVVLFEITGARIVTVLAIRHQREDDYH